MHWSHSYVKHHTPSRFLSHFSLSSQRTGFYFLFSFLFFNYFYLFYGTCLKTQDYKMSTWLRLVCIPLNRLIIWMVGPSINIWECSALVGAPSCIMSIECPDVRLLPKSFPHAEAQRRGLNNPGSTTVQCMRSMTFLFLLSFPFLYISASSLLSFSFHVLWLVQEYACNYMLIR